MTMSFTVFQWLVFLLGLVVWGFVAVPLLFGGSHWAGAVGWVLGWFGTEAARVVYKWWTNRQDSQSKDAENP